MFLDMGVRGLLISCSDYRRSHSIAAHALNRILFVFAVPQSRGMHQMTEAGFCSINSAKGFHLLHVEASQLQFTQRGLHLVQDMIDCFPNIVRF
jgi:hypothetical protein